MRVLRQWQQRGTGSLIARLAALGAAAGVAAWLLVLAVHPFFDVPRPGLTEFVKAIVRGIIIGALLGVVLGALWRRRREDRP